MANSDDDDAFLYSDEEQEVEEQGPKVKRVKFADEESNKEEDKTNEKEQQQQKQEASNSESGSGSGSESESGSESDDDIDIIIGDTQPTKSKSSGTTIIGNEALSEMTDPEESTSSSSTTAAAGTTTINKRQSSSAINLESVPRYQQEEDGEGDGTLITQLDIETLKLKPWRAPGVDVSDYFNYGFDS